MNGTNVSNPILERLADELEELTPEARKAATYVLENPQDVGVSTVREIAQAARVKPNTVVRMARQVGFEGYEDFRAPFRDEIKRGFPDRARVLQDHAATGKMGKLYRDIATTAIGNLQDTFASIDPATLTEAAKMVWAARDVYALGVGVNSANMQNFAYLASTGMRQFRAIPRSGSTPMDELAWADERDVVIATTCKPYRTEVVDAVAVARDKGLKIIAISDSPAAPILRGADFGFTISAETPQFFPSSVSLLALLETLLSFVIANASTEIIDRVEGFHKRRHETGLYVEEPQ